MLAVLAERPVLLAGSLSVAGLLVAMQVRFLRSLRSLEEALTIKQTIGQTNVRTKSTTPLTLRVRRGDGFADPVAVTTSLPPSVATDSAPIRVTLGRADTTAQASAKLTFPVAGTTRIDGVSVEVWDRYGLFEERLSRGEVTTITVEPRRPRNVQSDRVSERTASTLGGHRSGQLGQGIDAAELREYVAGDTVSNIDWKTTARS